MRIAFFDTKKYDRESFKKLEDHFSIDYFVEELNEKTVGLCTSKHDAVCCFVHGCVNRAVISKLKKKGIALVAMRCAGYNNVDLQAAIDLGVKVTRVPDYSPESVAEFTLALFFCLLRKVHRSYLRTRDLNFSLEGMVGSTLRGKTVGIVGTGRIGESLIHQLQGFGCTILAYDKAPKSHLRSIKGFQYVPMQRLIECSDIMTLHIPLNDESFHLINENVIHQMKEGAYIVNTGRGALIDSQALINGLKSKRIGGAALDVYELEDEYFFKDCSETIIDDDLLSRLLTFPNVIVTSHQGFLTHEALHSIAHSVGQSFIEYEKGVELTFEVPTETT